jgi:hypothetical protein
MVITGVPVATPLFVALMEMVPVVFALQPPIAAQELAVIPLTVNKRTEGPVGEPLLEPDGGGMTVVSTPLRVYATKAPEDPT